MNQEKDGNSKSNSLFYDTYALYAIAKGEENYREFASNYRVFTTLMNLYELYYILVKEGEINLADNFFNRLLSSCVKLDPSIVKKAAIFRYKNIKKKFSYLDCLGYVTAMSLNLKFLTGDNAFKDIENVKFVK